MNRKHCSAIIFICVILLSSPVSQVNVWAQAPKRQQIAFTRSGSIAKHFRKDRVKT